MCFLACKSPMCSLNELSNTAGSHLVALALCHHVGHVRILSCQSTIASPCGILLPQLVGRNLVPHISPVIGNFLCKLFLLLCKLFVNVLLFGLELQVANSIHFTLQHLFADSSAEVAVTIL